PNTFDAKKARKPPETCQKKTTCFAVVFFWQFSGSFRVNLVDAPRAAEQNRGATTRYGFFADGVAGLSNVVVGFVVCCNTSSFTQYVGPNGTARGQISSSVIASYNLPPFITYFASVVFLMLSSGFVLSTIKSASLPTSMDPRSLSTPRKRAPCKLATSSAPI